MGMGKQARAKHELIQSNKDLIIGLYSTGISANVLRDKLLDMNLDISSCSILTNLKRWGVPINYQHNNKKMRPKTGRFAHLK
jgi:hypothetical protein